MKKVLCNFFILICFTIPTGCVDRSPRLSESGVNTRFSFGMNVPFCEYIRQTRHMIENTRVNIDDDNREIILRANSPFEFKPNKQLYPKTGSGKFEKGILMIHGLSDSPYHIMPISRRLQSKGFLVRSVLLPGHGTRPGDLLNVDYKDWIKAVRYGMHRLELNAENLYIGGFSTGGTLSIYHALKNPEIRGIILFAPAMAIKTEWAWLAAAVRPFKKWLQIQNDVDYAKYESFTINAGVQIYNLINETNSLIEEHKHLNMPVFTALSLDDLTVDSEKTVKFFNKYVKSPKSLLILYKKAGSEHKNHVDGRIIYENSFLPKQRILNFSHTSIQIPPGDPHYGYNKDYKNCLHYKNNSKKWISCMNNSDVWQGEITGENLKNHLIRRLTYNPRYDRMIEMLDHFIDSIDESF